MAISIKYSRTDKIVRGLAAKHPKGHLRSKLGYIYGTFGRVNRGYLGLGFEFCGDRLRINIVMYKN